MLMKILTKPSLMQKVLGKEGIGSIEFIIDGVDNSTVRTLELLAPKAKGDLTEFNPFNGSLHFTARANKRMYNFLGEVEKYVPEDELPENYHQVLGYLTGKYN